ncbi:MAG: hypothetical protein SP1CHLAM54_09270 [Chlamydiia bacterium]|nr:hypothetical protein [Chlamydiia bacterium]MCH9615833.1 hypothetical protein [Chlamydiia bacterium]MCH9628764.1 hypothetical protein [Chlamydiia bacterium]
MIKDLGRLVAENSASQRVILSGDSFCAESSRYDYLPALITDAIGPAYLEENTATIEWFYDRYGQDRVNQLIDPRNERADHETVTVADVAKIMSNCQDRQAFNLEQITRVASRAFWFERVAINNGLAEFSWSLYDILPVIFIDILHALGFGLGIATQNRRVVEFLYESFGQRRIDAISDRFRLSIGYKHTHGISLGRYDIETLFLGLGQVHLTDMQEQYGQHQAEFGGREFEQLTVEDLRRVYDHCVPMDVEQLFCHNVPVVDPDTRIHHDTYEGMRLTTYMIDSLHRTPVGSLENTVRQAKRIYHRLLSDEIVIPGEGGYRYRSHSIHRAGAFIDFWKPVSRGQNIDKLVTALGTQTGIWDSLFGALRHNVGAGAPMALYTSLRELLTDPAFGFVDDANERVRGLGFSQGGSMMLRLATLFERKFSHLDLISDSGVDQATFRRLNERIRDITLHYIWDLGDHVPKCGLHPGFRVDPSHNVSVNIDLIAKVENQQEVLVRPPAMAEVPDEFLGFLRALKNALLGPHLCEYAQGAFEGRNATHRVWNYSSSSPHAVIRQQTERLLVNLDPLNSEGNVLPITDEQNPNTDAYIPPPWIASRLALTGYFGDEDEFVRFADHVEHIPNGDPRLATVFSDFHAPALVV